MKVSKIKEIVSYFMPIHVEACSSFHNPLLEVTLRNRRYVLDAKDSNYSFGALYIIFKNVFDELSIKERNINSCLLMGLGGGSIVNLLRKKHQLTMPIIGVEIDPVVIELGKKYFDLDGYKDLYVVNEDAYDFAKNCNSKFDLIIIDLYINDEVPGKFHTKEFISFLEKMSHKSSVILFNKMVNSKKAKEDYSTLVKDMSAEFGAVSLLTYKVNEVTNKIICVNTGRIHEGERQKNKRNVDLPIILLNTKLN